MQIYFFANSLLLGFVAARVRFSFFGGSRIRLTIEALLGTLATNKELARGVMMKRYVLILLAIFLGGCASKGFNRGALKEQVGIIKPTFEEKEIKDAFNKKPNLPKPFKLAVYFTQPKPAKGATKDWRWTDQDKAVLDEVGKELKASGLVSQIFPIISSLASTEDLKSLRLIAAKHQADALIIVGGAGEIDRFANDAGWSYLLLVPALFVKGSVAETLFLTNAAMWDVRNEYLYLTAEAEGSSRKTYPAAFEPKDEELLNEAKLNSLNNLRVEIKKMLQGAKL